MARKKKSKLNKMDVILILCVLLILAFTVTILVLSCQGYMIDSNLIICYFSTFGCEVGAMAWIKTTKEKAIERKNELADRKYFEKLNKENEDKGDE